MSTSSDDTIASLGTTRIIIPPGATNAVYVDRVAGCNYMVLKYFSGGSLEIIGVGMTNPPANNQGVTLTGAELVSAAGKHYIMSTTEVLNVAGNPPFYLQALNATTICMAIRGKSSGN